jgi:rfaE bifunctional protein nucleotidyltransferase chain/domain
LSKILTVNQLIKRVKKKKFSLVHGVFDLIHIGHKKHFDIARSYTDFLVVSLTSDRFVRKGPNRPVFSEQFRAEMVATFENVDAVVINDDVTSINLINKIKPNYYFKGNDYKNFKNDITNNIQKEINAVENNNGKVIFTDDVQFSSSEIINTNLLNLNVKDNKKFKSNCLKALNDIKNLSVCIIGEIIFDKYVYCSELEKPSKEMIQAVERKNEKLYLGGSFAIAKNISEFCKNIDLYIAGNFNKKIINILKKNKNDNVNLKIYKDEFNTITKTRFINFSGRKLFEIYERDGKSRKFNSRLFYNNLKKEIKKYDLVILSDFGHGFINDDLSMLIQKSAKFLSINAQTNADNRGFNLITKYFKANNIVIDQPEIRLALSDREKSISNLSIQLMKKIKTKSLMITMGKDGIHLSTILKKNKVNEFKLPAFEKKPIDTMGAGDAVFGICSLLAAKKINPEITIFLSNIFGSIATKILGHEDYIKKIEVTKSIQYMLK